MPAIERIPSDLPYPLSKAVRAGGFLFLSGQIPLGANGQPLRGDIAEQTRAVLDAIAQTLGQCGAGLSDLVRVTVWLSDMRHFGGFNDVYTSYFAGHLPARSTVTAALALGVDIEIEATAYRP